MCDERTAKDDEEFLKQSGISRREFTVLTGAAAMAVMAGLLPQPANAAAVKEKDVKIKTPDGTADCYFVSPASGKHPAVLIWPDAFGLRPAFRTMGKRLAESGYAVLVVNPFYRTVKAPVFPTGASFQDPPVREKLMSLMGALTPATNKTDALAFVAWLDKQKSVDKKRKMGTTGYCMGGAMTVRTAAALPDRVGAGGSFHGGRLVTKDENSPHLLIPSTKASYLYAIAENDDKTEPDTKTVLRDTYAKAGLPAEIEVYAGAMHGWCALDSQVYNQLQAERAWGRLLALFQTALV